MPWVFKISTKCDRSKITTSDGFEISACFFWKAGHFYVNASVRIRWIAPQDIGVRRIGHFGFFRAGFQGSLWTNHLIPELI